jgi:hypothetical protein
MAAVIGGKRRLRALDKAYYENVALQFLKIKTGIKT